MYKLVFDLGGTFIKYALMSDTCEFVEKGKVKTPEYEVNKVLATLKDVIDRYADRINGIAISLPGMMDSDTGFMYTGGSFECFNNVNFFDLMKSITNLPVSIENDGKAAALAEVWQGNLSDVNDGIVAILGTGIGGALIKDKKVHKGKHFSAGEFSFLMVNDVFDFKSAFAMKCSVPGLVHRVEVQLGMDTGTLDGIKLFELIEEGNEVAVSAFEEYTKTLAIQLYNLQMIFDPEKILLGGGVSQQPRVQESVQRHLDAFYNSLPMNPPRVNLGVCKFFNDSNLIGALYHHLQQYKMEE